MFVLFEGLDLSGKSTLCRRLSESTGWSIRNNSLLPKGENPYYSDARESHKMQSATDLEVGEIFLKALQYDIEHYANPGTPYIQDSTILLRSIAYHQEIGNIDLVRKFEAFLEKHPKPFVSFLCQPSIEVRLKRLSGRISRNNDTPEDHIIRQDPDRFRRMENTISGLVRRHFKMRALDTSLLEDPDKSRELLHSVSQTIKELIP